MALQLPRPVIALKDLYHQHQIIRHDRTNHLLQMPKSSPEPAQVYHAHLTSCCSHILHCNDSAISIRCSQSFVGAERDIAKGEQLLHTYGDLSNAQLLQTYGFVEDFEPGYDNPHNFVPVPTVLLLQSCSEAGDEVHAAAAMMQVVQITLYI